MLIVQLQCMKINTSIYENCLFLHPCYWMLHKNHLTFIVKLARKEKKTKWNVSYFSRVLPVVRINWNICAWLWEGAGEKHVDNCCEYPVLKHHSQRRLISQQFPRCNTVRSMLHTACINEMMGFQFAASKPIRSPWSDFKMARKGDYKNKILYSLYRLETDFFGPQLLEIENLWVKSLNRLMGVITTMMRHDLRSHKTSASDCAIRGSLSLSAANTKPEHEKPL